MKRSLPDDPKKFMEWSWAEIEPFFLRLEEFHLDEGNAAVWLGQWSHLAGLLYETYQRNYVSITTHTNDQRASKRYNRFLDEIFAPAEAADQRLKEKLLSSGIRPSGFELPLRNLRADVSLFCVENLPLLAEELKLSARFDQIVGEQTVKWEGKEVTLLQLEVVLGDPDRQARERSWRLAARRRLDDREAFNRLWIRILGTRIQQAKNAGLADYRAYRWAKMIRFDYTAEDCYQFHQAIEKVAVPAASELYERRRKKLRTKSLRPWDLKADPANRKPLKPFQRAEELEEGTARIFRRVDPQLGDYFEIMRREGLLDLENRKGKAPGGYCTDFPVSGRPFILMNATGIHEDVQTLLHEGGHAFHVFEANGLPYFHQKRIGFEFMEVASMGMELLASPYLTKDEGGFYSADEAARARIEFLEEAICFWPYMAVVDAFQHWVYENPDKAAVTTNCDAKWGMLWDLFMPGVDWSGLEEERVTGWQRKLHIFQDPFYFIDYGLAMLGAFQVWRNAQHDQAGAAAAYRKALKLGGTVPLPDLFKEAGARLAFDAETLQQAVDLGMRTIEVLESQLEKE